MFASLSDCFRRSWKKMLAIGLPLAMLSADFVAYYQLRMPGGEVRLGPYGSFPALDAFFIPARLVAEGPVRRVSDAIRRATTDDAERVVEAALRQARAEDKRVLLVICTTHCLPCRQLDGFFKEIAPLLDRHLIVLKLNIDALQNGEEIHRRFRTDINDAPAYIPWMAVLDSSGTILQASPTLGDDGGVALPLAGDRDRRYFIEMLRRTTPAISATALDEIDRTAQSHHARIWGRD